MKKFIALLIGSFFLSASLSACGPMIKTDLKSLNENPEKYKGKRVIVTTNLKSVVDSPEAYLGKRIELAGYVRATRFEEPNEWSFILEDKSERSIKSYVEGYEDANLIMHELALGKAVKENELVTVVGEFQKGPRLELEWIEAEGLEYNIYILTWDHQ
jgi:hypothetical protein